MMPEAWTPLIISLAAGTGAAPSQPGFAALDWAIVLGYLCVVIAIGIAVTRRRSPEGEFFLAGRTMPMWAVAISILATSQSAATFVGGPQEAFARDFTYLAANLGALIAVIIVALFFIPAYYRLGVTSVYELIGHHHGSHSQRLASGMFMLGRVFASGARLFIVAIPFALVAFGNVEPRSLLISIVIITIGATIYTSFGGIRAVIWTDLLQAIIYIGAIIFAVWFLWQRMPVGAAELIEIIAREEPDKLRLIDTSRGVDMLSRPYNLWAILIGLTLFNTAAFGADQDLTQRMLTCRTARQGAWSVILSNIIGWPIVALFMLMGVLLWVYYQHPEAVGLTRAAYHLEDSRTVFLDFILNEMPTGIRGLMMAGLFAAAMSTLDSGLNAMASTTVADFVRPALTRRGYDGNDRLRLERIIARAAIVFWAIMLGSFACFCIYWHAESDDTLIAFALGVMVYAYAGLLAVFLTVLFTPFGSPLSVAAAFLGGVLTVLMLQYPGVWLKPLGLEPTVIISFSWRMVFGTAVAFIICCAGGRRKKVQRGEPQRAAEEERHEHSTVNDQRSTFN